MLVVVAFVLGLGVAAAALVLARGWARGGDDRVLHALREELARYDGEQRDRAQDLYGRLRVLGDHQAHLVEHTGRLSEALRRPGMRGRWGELTLRNVVESAGLAEHVDFDEQAHLGGEDGAGARPDMLVHLPGGGHLIVDAKVPLDAHLDASAARGPDEIARALDRHVHSVRARVRELAGRAYWTRVRGSPEMVVMFIPSEAAFAAAASRDPGLLEDAARQRVVIATPATMLALLQVVALGWREAALSEHAERVRELAHELIGRLGAVGNHLAREGRALEAAVQAHNSAVGSFESRLLVSARRMGDLGVADAAGLEAPPGVASAVRLPSAERAPADR
ncbi:MAG TPA: DNA recombination protein RmuC [Solirubrobacteraceae bacterium]|jgi:DNA recombination protein RmuC|nr:DNA recombination protein RmuC [Solirubrobacteraceae bacterium]